jgi:putative aminopeptidase FrvX
MNKLVRTFLELAAIDEVHPNEKQVIAYITGRLEASKVPYKRDAFGNIVATIAGQAADAMALAGHVDIAAPLLGREVIVEADTIKNRRQELAGRRR